MAFLHQPPRGNKIARVMFIKSRVVNKFLTWADGHLLSAIAANLFGNRQATHCSVCFKDRSETNIPCNHCCPFPFCLHRPKSCLFLVLLTSTHLTRPDTPEEQVAVAKQTIKLLKLLRSECMKECRMFSLLHFTGVSNLGK